MDPSKNYYTILSLKKDASEADIKKAFHRLAKEFHPDLNPDKPEAEARFKEINEAYDVLSDSKKRAEYDQIQKYGAGFNAPPGAGGRHPRSNGTVFDGNLEDLFGGARGNLGDIFSQFFNMGGGKKRRNYAQKGQDFKASVKVPFKTAVNGGKSRVQFGIPGKGQKTIEINIPTGIRNGGKIRLRGLGAPGINGGAAGDLIVIVQVATDSFFRREGNDIYADITIGLKIAIEGAKILVRVPSGEKVKLTIPPGTQPGTKFRIPERGIVSKAKKGDFFIVVNVKIPEKLDNKSKELFEKFVKKAGL
ncbi:DnaJ domain-containing protein [bacterium]|nr:DnaJ domain-containing protein [bacterium]